MSEVLEVVEGMISKIYTGEEVFEKMSEPSKVVTAIRMTETKLI